MTVVSGKFKIMVTILNMETVLHFLVAISKRTIPNEFYVSLVR